MKHSCINCAFCVRGKQFITRNFSDFIPHNITLSLTKEEHQKAEQNDFSFLGKEKREQEIWIQQYNKNLDKLKKGYYNPIFGNRNVLELLLKSQECISTANGNPYPLSKTFHMSDCPQAPQKDYLYCWHNLWNFENEPEKCSSINDKNKCLFFYPYTQKENKSFEGCEKERQAKLNQNHFYITSFLVILGIIIAFATSVMIHGCQQRDNQRNNNILNRQRTDTMNKLENIERISLENQHHIQAIQNKGAPANE